MCKPLVVSLQIPDIQADVLVGNLEEVAALSGDFLRALEEVCQHKKQVQVGGVFVTFAPRIKSVYGVYCRNHDNASVLYEKVSSAVALKCMLRSHYCRHTVHGQSGHCRQHPPCHGYAEVGMASPPGRYHWC